MREARRLTATDLREQDRAGLGASEQALERVDVLDGLSVHLENDVAGADLFQRARGRDRLDANPAALHVGDLNAELVVRRRDLRRARRGALERRVVFERVERRLHVLALAVAKDAQGDLRAGSVARDVARQLFGVRNLGAVDGEDDVAGLEAGARGRAARLDLSDERALRTGELERLGELVGHRLEDETELAADDVTLLAELRQDVLQRVDRNREADVVRAGSNGRRDAYHLTPPVEERPAAVAGVDRRVGLDEVVVARGADETRLCADDAERDGVPETERVTDGQDVLADAKPARSAEANRGEVVAALDLEEGEIELGIATDHVRRELAVVPEADRDEVGVVHDVLVGDDVALRVDDEPGARALTLASRRAAIGPEEEVERVPLGEVHLLGRGDVHDRGLHLLRKVGDVERRGHRSRRQRVGQLERRKRSAIDALVVERDGTRRARRIGGGLVIARCSSRRLLATECRSERKEDGKDRNANREATLHLLYLGRNDRPFIGYPRNEEV